MFRMQNISDKALQLIAENYQELESLNLTRYVTDRCWLLLSLIFGDEN
jgi:hypothetical protein